MLCHSTAVSDRFYATNPDEAEARRVRQIIDSALEASAQSRGTGGPRKKRAEAPDSGSEGPDSGAEGPDSGPEGPETPKKAMRKSTTSRRQREREGEEVS